MLRNWPASQPDGGGGEADADVEDVAAAILDRFHLAHDVAQDLGFDDGGDRHLHALLDRDRLGARLDRGGVRLDAVDRGEALCRHVDCSPKPAGGTAGTTGPYGISTVLPVVFRDSSAICAAAASFSGKVWFTSIFTAPFPTTSNRSAATFSRSARFGV